MAAFCDATRDAVKGSLFRAEDAGFVNGGGLDAEKLARCVRGWAGEGLPHRAPSQTVNYLSCHDDWTLWDKLAAVGPGRSGADLLRQNRLAAAINFSCQGSLFLLAGEEFARTKNGVKNTYRSSPELNRLDWERAWEHEPLADYYRGLIALRKRLPGLCDKSPGAGARLLANDQFTERCAGVLLDNAGDSPWRLLCLIFNGGEDTVDAELPEGVWDVLADGDSSWRWQAPYQLQYSARLGPASGLILGQR